MAMSALLQAAAAGAQRLELVSLQADVLLQCGEATEALAEQQREQVEVAQQQVAKAAKRAAEELEQSDATVAGGQAGRGQIVTCSTGSLTCLAVP